MTQEFHALRLQIAVLASVLLVLTGCSRHKVETQASQPVPVQLRKPTLVDRPEIVDVSGSVTSPDAPSDVPFLVSGRVTRVAVHEGDFVHKGQLLAALEATDYQLAVNGADAQVAAAKVALDRAEDEYKRMKMLFDAKSLAPNDFRKFEATWQSAKEQLNQAVASEKTARKHVSDATLVAPVTGYISRRGVEPGNMAVAGNPAFQIVTLDPAEVLVGVPETDIHLLRLGQPAEVEIPAMSGAAFSGTVREINVAADSTTRTYSTRIRVPNPQHQLRIGMVAEVHIKGDHTTKALTLPGSAIAHDQQGATLVFVYYPEQKRVFSKRVEVGRVIWQDVEIRSGLGADEEVVIGGLQGLRDGTQVEPSATLPPQIPVSGAHHKVDGE
jgi:RND family efflux transporter MFP subunit